MPVCEGVNPGAELLGDLDDWGLQRVTVLNPHPKPLANILYQRNNQPLIPFIELPLIKQQRISLQVLINCVLEMLSQMTLDISVDSCSAEGQHGHLNCFQ